MRAFRHEDLEEISQIGKCCDFVKLSFSNTNPETLQHNITTLPSSKPNMRKPKLIKLTLAANTVQNNSLSISSPPEEISLTNSVSYSIKKKMKEIKSECKTDFDSSVKLHEDRSDVCSIIESEGPQVFEGGRNLSFLYSSVSEQF